MNALDRIFMNSEGRPAGAGILGVAAASALLSGCMGGAIASVKVDPASPVAPEVARMAAAGTTYPKFSDIPPAPTDLRAPAAYGERARKLEVARDELNAQTAPGSWTLGSTDSFVSRARAQAGPAFVPPAGGGAEAFANTVRKRATPPPPANP